MKIVYMGTPDFAVAPLKALIDAGYEVAAVFTQGDKPKNRGMKLTPPPVKEFAITQNIPVYQPKSFKTDEAYNQLAEINPDLVVVTAYGKLLPKRVLDLPKYGCINVHASLLPLYRGASPIQQVIIRGEKETGVTIMQMNEGLDTGDMLAVKQIAITDDETAETLHDKLMEVGGEVLLEAVKLIESNNVTPIKQPSDCPFYAPLIKKSDGEISFKKTAIEIDRLARAMQPWPGNFSSLGGLNVKIFGIKAEKCTNDIECGKILSCDKSGLKVSCADGIVTIAEIQAPGKKRISCDDYFRGHSADLNLQFE